MLRPCYNGRMSVREGNSNQLPYRSPVTTAPAQTPFTQDEAQYNTLVMVRNIFGEAIDGLYKEFNAFDVLSDGTDQEKIDKMMRQIAGNQIAYDILSPLKERLDNAITTADDNYKQRNNQK